MVRRKFNFPPLEYADVDEYYCGGVGLKKGKFDESNRDLKCYTFCVAQMSGTLSKKNEISGQKMLTQIDTLAPDEIKEHGRAVWEACKTSQQGISEKCDRVFAFTRCMYNLSPEKFLYP